MPENFLPFALAETEQAATWYRIKISKSISSDTVLPASPQTLTHYPDCRMKERDAQVKQMYAGNKTATGTTYHPEPRGSGALAVVDAFSADEGLAESVSAFTAHGNFRLPVVSANSNVRTNITLKCVRFCKLSSEAEKNHKKLCSNSFVFNRNIELMSQREASFYLAAVSLWTQQHVYFLQRIIKIQVTPEICFRERFLQKTRTKGGIDTSPLISVESTLLSHEFDEKTGGGGRYGDIPMLRCHRNTNGRAM